MTVYQIKNRTLVAIRLFWIASEDIEDLAAIVLAAGKLTIAVVVGIPSRISESLQLLAFRVAYQLEVRVSIASEFIVILTDFILPLLARRRNPQGTGTTASRCLIPNHI